MSTRFNPGRYLRHILRLAKNMTQEEITDAEKELWVGLASNTTQIAQLTDKDIEFKQLVALRKVIDDRRFQADQCFMGSTGAAAESYHKLAQADETEIIFLDNLISGLLRSAFDPNNPRRALYYFHKDWAVIRADI